MYTYFILTEMGKWGMDQFYKNKIILSSYQLYYLYGPMALGASEVLITFLIILLIFVCSKFIVKCLVILVLVLRRADGRYSID